jgi:DNA-binding transcriptional LysR family regulator
LVGAHPALWLRSAADHGSFPQAAEALLLRQSSLSRTIRQLDDVLEVKLFERLSGGVRATAAGRNFLSAARSILIRSINF